MGKVGSPEVSSKKKTTKDWVYCPLNGSFGAAIPLALKALLAIFYRYF